MEPRDKNASFRPVLVGVTAVAISVGDANQERHPKEALGLRVTKALKRHAYGDTYLHPAMDVSDRPGKSALGTELN